MTSLSIQFEQAKETLQQGNISESLVQFCNLLRQATEQYGETQWETAQYYYGYANVLLYQQESGDQDVFGVEMGHPNEISEQSNENGLGVDDEEEDDELDDNNEKIDEKSNQMIQIKGEKQEDQEQSQNQNEQISQQDDAMELIWENLETARFICDSQWQKIVHDDQISNEHKLEVLQLTAKVVKRLGDFLCLSDQFSKAIQEYQRCLEIRQKIDDNMLNRELAELQIYKQRYFVIGSTLLLEGKSNCEDLAIRSFKRGKRILENNLADKINLTRQNFDNNYDKQLLTTQFFESEDVQDLKNMIKDMWEKIEDTQLQLDQKDSVIQATKQIPQEQGFDKPQLNNQNVTQVPIINKINHVQITRNIQPVIQGSVQQNSQNSQDVILPEKKIKFD